MFSDIDSEHVLDIESSNKDFSSPFVHLIPSYRLHLIKSVLVSLRSNKIPQKMRGVMFLMKDHKDKLLLIETTEPNTHVLLSAKGRKKTNGFHDVWKVESYSKIFPPMEEKGEFYAHTETLNKFALYCFTPSKHQLKRKRKKEREKKIEEDYFELIFKLKMSGLVVFLIIVLLSVYQVIEAYNATN